MDSSSVGLHPARSYGKSRKMQRYFGPQGLLSQKIKDFEYRPSQMEMAEAISECLGKEIPLLVEAGTGTGKTWAYLIPAILSGKRTIVSTGTKTLQDQILDQDIPFLKRVLFPKLQAVCLKGRKNYLCRRRFRGFIYQPTFWGREEAKLLRRFQNWAVRTRTGERSEIEWLPDNFQTWDEVSSNSDQCFGPQCEEHQHCYLTRVRLEASRAQIIVVNHHLFFADLALRGLQLAEILPDYEAVIFDEAHQLHDIIGNYFGYQFSNTGLRELMRDIAGEVKANGRKPQEIREIQGILQHVETLARLLHHHLYQLHGTHGRFPLNLEKGGEGFIETSNQAIQALERLNAIFTPSSNQNPSRDSFYRRTLEMIQSIQVILDQKDKSLVYWYELTPHAVFLRGTPIEVSEILREKLFTRISAVVATSATLSVAGSFEYMRSSLGLPEETRELLLPSPFAYEQQTRMYIPSQFPSPQEREFCRYIAEEASEILVKTRGRALFLFTSYRNMKEVYELLQGRLPYTILVQGQKPKRVLLNEFRDKIDSILFATSSFWQGVDVPGEALSCLLIDKLPFEVPDDPVIGARMQSITEQGGNAFFSYQVPRAIIQLKQGVGRLIRSSRDRGIIVIFDKRLYSKGYGRLFLKSLPASQIVHDINGLDGFLDG